MGAREPEQPKIAEWVVTFGDMMSLLLTFFIMMLSMSEIKEEQKYQALVEAMRRRFGHETSMLAPMPGPSQPRNSPVEKMASMGRARRADTMKGGDKVRAPVGENPRVRALRPADDQTVGGKLLFEPGSGDLTEEHKRQLVKTAQELGGKPQKIEIRGHTSSRPLPPDSPYRSHWDLAYARCVKTMEHLVKLGINPKRIRLSVAADNEPVHSGIDPVRQKENPRVDIYMLNELTKDLEGNPGEQSDQFAPDAAQ
jgi:chemotaxis protein MotB